MANGPLYGIVPTQSMYAIATGAIPSYRVVVRDVVDASTNGITAKLPAAATDPILGVANNGIAAVAGDQVHVIQEGRAWGVANAAIARGDRLITDVDGRLGPALNVVGEQHIGIAEEAAGALGDIFAFQLRPYIR
jgi:hypothetical protein